MRASSLIDVLIEQKRISAATATQIRRELRTKKNSVDAALQNHGISEQDIAEAKSVLTKFPFRNLEGLHFSFEVLRDIPEESARHYAMVPLGRKDGYLEVGMRNPENVSAQEALKFLSARINLPTRIFVLTQSDLEHVLKEYRGLSGEVTKALGQYQKERASEEILFSTPTPSREKEKISDEAPVTKMVDVMIRHAVEGRASDIHIEPGREQLRIRFRVDGILHTSITLPRDVHPAFVTRIKVLSNLKIDETRVPQDGRFHAELMDRGIDFRISTLPTSFGEKVVIRILDPQTGIASFEKLGIEGRNLDVITESLKRPYGLILITGPTGSGKSTTLYAMLQTLNQERANIVSLEDPIEYYVPGVAQSQIRPEIGYDFATGLRHILRQDPDIILVGEIRDKETAYLAIHAALTGHLVLSTLHTNNAIGVVPRLIDMGVDPFLIAPTLVLAIGQRLTRTLCPDSRKKIKIEGRAEEIIHAELAQMPTTIRAQLEKNMPQEIYHSEISPTCPKGTRGRIGIYETLLMTPQLSQIILSHPSEAGIVAEAKRQEMTTIRQDGILKVLKGVIGLEELLETT
ncbi:MAG: hypothetical protein G01um101466_405 [Parcubacteria group bacterium Gr01-1014_66]|nr:MAG: hypothetical protein G01um101466_405 [Parcubacteria group bacterium Gr01-1014_66]